MDILVHTIGETVLLLVEFDSQEIQRFAFFEELPFFDVKTLVDLLPKLNKSLILVIPN